MLSYYRNSMPPITTHESEIRDLELCISEDPTLDTKIGPSSSTEECEISEIDSEWGNSYDELACSHCQSADDDDQMLICDKCDHGYHMFCLRPILVSLPPGDWFCPTCSKKPRIKEFPLVQKKIMDFFKLEKPLGSCLESKRRKKSGLTVKKKTRFLVPHRPAPDVSTRMRHMAALATALTTVGAEFSNELMYTAGAPKSANRPQLEVKGMQEMCKEDLATYDTSRAMWQRGEVPPVVVRMDPSQGFVVEADAPIPDMTFIAEYVGEVDFMSNRAGDASDSLMGLLFTGNECTDLVACPNRFANVARFVSGINNSSRDGRKKINVRCIRFNIRGEAHALLIAIRDIRKGERLYYDYNGYQKEYPTNYFE